MQRWVAAYGWAFLALFAIAATHQCYQLWPTRREALEILTGQVTSHQLLRLGRMPKVDHLTIRLGSGELRKAQVQASFVPELGTISQRPVVVEVDGNGWVFTLNVDGQNKLSYEAVASKSRKDFAGALILFGAIGVLLLAYLSAAMASRK